MEQSFVAAAAIALPIDEAEVRRNDSGVLYYFWRSPCDALEGLWVYVNEHEIVIATKLFHTHVSNTTFLAENLPESELPKRIVAESVNKILAILGGDVIFTETKHQDGSGNEGTSFGTSPRHAWDNRHLRDHGAWAGITQRAWNWLGEIPVT